LLSGMAANDTTAAYPQPDRFSKAHSFLVRFMSSSP